MQSRPELGDCSDDEADPDLCLTAIGLCVEHRWRWTTSQLGRSVCQGSRVDRDARASGFEGVSRKISPHASVPDTYPLPSKHVFRQGGAFRNAKECSSKTVWLEIASNTGYLQCGVTARCWLYGCSYLPEEVDNTALWYWKRCVSWLTNTARQVIRYYYRSPIHADLFR